MWVVQLDTCEALLPRSEGCVEEAEVGLQKGSCRLGREDHEQRDGVQETHSVSYRLRQKVSTSPLPHTLVTVSLLGVLQAEVGPMA